MESIVTLFHFEKAPLLHCLESGTVLLFEQSKNKSNLHCAVGVMKIEIQHPLVQARNFQLCEQFTFVGH